MDPVTVHVQYDHIMYVLYTQKIIVRLCTFNESDTLQCLSVPVTKKHHTTVYSVLHKEDKKTNLCAFN